MLLVNELQWNPLTEKNSVSSTLFFLLMEVSIQGTRYKAGLVCHILMLCDTGVQKGPQIFTSCTAAGG